MFNNEPFKLFTYIEVVPQFLYCFVYFVIKTVYHMQPFINYFYNYKQNVTLITSIKAHVLINLKHELRNNKI